MIEKKLMKDEFDIKKVKKRPGKVKVDPSPKIMISIRLEAGVLASIKDEADSLGVGYQTLISSILKKHVGPENVSFEDRLIERVLKRLEKAGVVSGKKKQKVS